ncbi:matrix-binding protein EbhB [Streptococcus parasuis]|uniref:phage tail spike protein n=1 Tax=Streptococcus parasuis TaxID=1501662 RepID=UPI001C2C32E1|nr:phage tail spike protein [Streptococcus parasuis]MBV1943666.1 matrix-binding protein EbhB [Streptococcus parasuis]QXF06054.1 matrix-binding protein EbhB [Streptococcus parasuis]
MLYLLDKDTKTFKWNGIPLHEASSAVVKEETNGDFYLTVHYPITDSGVYQLIKEDMLIKAPTPVLGPQLFRIKKPVENDDSLDITAYHISDDVMQRSIRPVSVVGQGCAIALSQMVQNAKTGLGDFSFASDIMDSRTFNTTETETLYSVLLDGKHSIVGTWEGELVRDNFALTIKRNRGADRGVVITTHKNLKSYQRTKNSQSVVTRIHAKSTFKAEGAEEETTINVTVDSPLIGNYPYINEKDYENNNAKTVEELRKWAEAKFANEGIDKVSDAIEIEAYELDGQVIHIGDTVNIKSRKHDVDLYKKAIAYDYNALTEEYISITFDDKPGVGGSGISSGVANAADVILSANRNAQEVAIERAVINANKAFDAEFDKRVEIINDGIEQAKAEAELYADNIKQSIDAEIDAVNTSMQEQSEEHDRQVADILSKTQSVEALANQAKTDAANAITEAIRLDTIERQATEAKVATAKSQAIAEANELVETAKGLLSGQISNVSTDLSQTKEAIKLLATRATVDALTGRISTAESTLQVQAGEIASRVKTSDFDQAKQRISTAESSITQLGNRITTEISTVESKIPKEIGGVNLIKNSRVVSIESNHHGLYPISKETLSEGSRTFLRSRRSNITLNPSVFSIYSTISNLSDTAKNYDKGIVSFKARASHPVTMSTMIYKVNTSGNDTYGLQRNIDITTNWQTFSFEIPLGSDLYYIRSNPLATITDISSFIDSFYLDLCEWKLEGGDIPTGWSLAPEDIIDELSSVKTTITQTASGVEQLSTSLSTTNNKVSTAETKISQLISDVSSKVSQTDYNTLTGRVSNAESAITQNATEISKRLTSTQVEQAIADKGYATVAVLENRVKETADSFSRTISETKALIPTEIGGNNLLKNTKDFSGEWDYNGKNRKIAPWKYKGLSAIKADYMWDGLTQLIQVMAGEVYTFSSYVASNLGFDSANIYIHLNNYRTEQQAVVDNGYRRFNMTSTFQRVSITFKVITDGYIAPRIERYDLNGILYFAGMKLERGTIATDWTPATEDLATVTALHAVNDTVDSHTRTIGAVGTTGSILDNVSKVTQTANGLVTEVSGANGLKTQVSTLAGSYAIQNLTNSGTVLNQLNLNKDGTVKIDGKLVQITGTTYIQDGVISSAKIGSLDAGKITTGTLNAARIATNSITGSHIVFDQAFVNKMTANEAMFKQLFAQNAFITSVQSKDISANLISGGVLKSTNGATNFDLNNGNLLFNNNYGYIRRAANDKIFEITTLLTEKSNYSPEGLSSKFMIRKSDSSRQSGVSFNLYTTVDGKPTATTQIYSDSFTITSSDYTTLFSLGSKNSYLGTLNLQGWGDIPVATMSGGLVVKDIGIGGHTESLLKVVERLCIKTGLMWI